LDLEALARGGAFLLHPAVHHRVEDHMVADISADKCSQQVGKIAARALVLQIVGDPDQAAAQLSKIPGACPGGQTLGGRCEGDPDELGCLSGRLQVLAQFFATSPHDTCGDGIVSAQEQCEVDRDCGEGNRCLRCRCVSTICGLALCGNGKIDPGEECDDGNTNDNDACVSCKVAVCGDGVVCSDPSCTSGRDGTPEQCDPPGPDSVHCFANCLPDCSCEIVIGSAPAAGAAR
jgi:cysteine-rich repeat protein